MAASHNKSVSAIGAVGEQVAAAQQHLPFAPMDAAANHIETAAAIVDEVGTDNTQAHEAGVYISGAQENLGHAAVAITAGHDALSAYTAHIGVSSQPAHGLQPQEAAPSSAQPASGTAEQHQQGKGVCVTAQRRIGTTKFNIVFSKHSAENAPQLAAAMGPCDIVAIEVVGFSNDATRRYIEQEVTEKLAGYASPEEALAPLVAEEGPFTGALLAPYAGTGAKVKMLDISRDHPDHPLTDQSKEAQNAFTLATVLLKPMAEIRAAAAESIAADMRAITARDAVVRKQLRAIAAEAGDVTVGVMVGAMHAGAVTGMEAPDNETDEALKRRIWQRGNHGPNIGPIAPGHMTMDEVADRAILDNFLAMSQIKVEALSLATLLGPRRLASVLDGIDAIYDKENTYNGKIAHIQAYLQEVVNIVQREALPQ